MNKPVKTQPLIQHDWVDIKFNLRSTWNLVEVIWFLFFSYIYLFILTCVCHSACVEASRQWWKSVLSFHSVGSGDWSQSQWHSDPLSHLLKPRTCDSCLPLSLSPPLDFLFQPPGWMGVDIKHITHGPRSGGSSWRALGKKESLRGSHTTTPGLHTSFRTDIIDEERRGCKVKNSSRNDECLKKQKCQSS